VDVGDHRRKWRSGSVDEKFDVYVVIVPADDKSFEAMTATVIQYEDAATGVTWEEAEEIQQRAYMVDHD
jgi:hypothetical protein